MSDQSINKIKQQLQLLYPELFDDSNAKNKLDPLINQSEMLLNQYKGDVSDKQFQQLAELMTAHLLYQSEDNNISSVAIADVHFSLNDDNKSSSNGDGTGNGDKYLSLLLDLLKSLGYQGWSIQFD